MLATMHENYIVNEQGHKTAVILSLRDWETIQEMLEDLDDIRAYDKVIAEPSEPVLWEKVVKELKK